jgi:hypothetical protein
MEIVGSTARVIWGIGPQTDIVCDLMLQTAARSLHSAEKMPSQQAPARIAYARHWHMLNTSKEPVVIVRWMG